MYNTLLKRNNFWMKYFIWIIFKVYIFCQIKNGFFSRMLEGNLFLYERVSIFELDERVFSNPIVANCLNTLFVLLITFSSSQRYFTLTVRDVYFFYIADIVSRCAKIYSQWFAYSFVRKKNAYRQTVK